MSPLSPKPKQTFINAVLLTLTILACGPLDRLQEFNRQTQKTPLAATTVGPKNQLNITAAYQKIETLPGYRLENHHLVRDKLGNRIKQTITSEYDASGNAHLLIQENNGLQNEIYLVGGNTYIFEPQYASWLELKTFPFTRTQQISIALLGNLHPAETLVQLLDQTRPEARDSEIYLNRPVTRYVVADTIEEIDQKTGNSPLDVRGTLWIDDNTGAIIKSELFIYEPDDSQPAQEFVWEISEIGNVPPISAPTPVIDLSTIASATATAQVQITLPARLNYQGEQVDFEIVPLQVTQRPEVSPRSAAVHLVLRQLPGHLFEETNLEPFLALLQTQLNLSIPERNLVVTSSGFNLIDSDKQKHTLEVQYLYNADLENLSHIELILSGQGNPVFAPVPVE
ncbi:MAG: hypothetical protein JW953_23430 [Anaerolineae bacterium]|nr:hypothetical protein [Anaerolineae bacterium]